MHSLITLSKSASEIEVVDRRGLAVRLAKAEATRKNRADWMR
jgi:hypothetical protein